MALAPQRTVVARRGRSTDGGGDRHLRRLRRGFQERGGGGGRLSFLYFQTKKGRGYLCGEGFRLILWFIFKRGLDPPEWKWWRPRVWKTRVRSKPNTTPTPQEEQRHKRRAERVSV